MKIGAHFNIRINMKSVAMLEIRIRVMKRRKGVSVDIFDVGGYIQGGVVGWTINVVKRGRGVSG